jgi:holo-[acyl-carrier protein] synthase
MIKVETGIDMVEITRLSQLKPAIRERFLNRVYTERELGDAANRNDHLAGRFAAKEAAAKALGTGIGDIHWQDLEIQIDATGKPSLVLYGEAEKIAQQKGWVSWSVSITHTAGMAVAIVIALLDCAPST